MKKIKVLVVDDSAFMRKIVSDIIASDPKLEVIDTAKNGKLALQKIKTLRPDVVTMDIEMPEMDGLAALKTAMQEHPLPIIMLSSLTEEGADATLLALEYGAVDFIAKPSSVFKVNTEEVKQSLLAKIHMAATIKRFNRPSAMPQTGSIQAKPKPQIQPKRASHIKRIIAIGTSTGGPKALQSVIPLLDAGIEAPVLIVQHMPPGFTKSLAERLDGLSQITVKEAQAGEVLQAGHAYIAPGDQHMLVKRTGGQFTIELNKGPTVSGHRPSVDAMFSSLAELNLKNIIGVIMTGMGADGANGIAKLNAQNNYTIAQNEATCVVYGMPKSAVKLGAIDKVAPLEQLPQLIMKAMED